MELAKAEVREKGKAAGLEGGMFGGAGLVALSASARSRRPRSSPWRRRSMDGSRR
jgi:hypothetical protein